ncbi:MAG: hypothetical protein JWR05_1539, partial [Mucilaginibacter sp.]|nr:hypothetical protein [Mucilaginibacter sp.]
FSPHKGKEEINTVSVSACQLLTAEEYLQQEEPKAEKDCQYLTNVATKLNSGCFSL